MVAEKTILTVEIGSTITKVNGFTRKSKGGLLHTCQGFAPTSITQGDVMIGVEHVLSGFDKEYNAFPKDAEVFVNSSAAGGLRMTVHGLTYSMTARAAREAALGAGAIIKKVTAGLLDDYDLEEIREIHPNIILLAGGDNMTADEPVTYPRISLEEVIRRKPEVILVSSMEREGRFEKARQDWLQWTSIPAVQKGKVHLIDSDLIDRPSPRVVDGLEIMAKLLHPEVFK